MKKITLLFAVMGIFFISTKNISTNQGRWTIEKANEWYAKQPWIVGCNFIPSTAINQLEMWQKNTFDPTTIDKELGWAENLGFNTVRVYLHDLAYAEEPEGFLNRLDKFLDIANSHKIRTIFVIFDDCWLDNPKQGIQPEAWEGVHNSGWVQSPGLSQLKHYSNDTRIRTRLETYTKAVLERFKNDKRVLMWDLYNEPGGWWYRRGEKIGKFEKGLVDSLCIPLLNDVYRWSRQINLTQPRTTCWNRGAYEVAAAFNQADIITFHHYGSVQETENLINKIKKEVLNRPIVCTEYLSRGYDSNFQTHLPFFKKHKIGAINWGLVSGKTNTIWAWDSWEKPNPAEPKVWHHDILHKNGTPFNTEEINFIQTITKEK